MSSPGSKRYIELELAPAPGISPREEEEEEEISTFISTYLSTHHDRLHLSEIKWDAFRLVLSEIKAAAAACGGPSPSSGGGMGRINGLILKNELEKLFERMFGPRVLQQQQSGTKTKPKPPKTKVTTPSLTLFITIFTKIQPQTTMDSSSALSIFEEGFLGSLHKPGENSQRNDKLREEHLSVTGGKVRTRFPPERKFSFFF